ncbi:acyl-CoA dehydratase activase-related protein [Clostridium cibarium]|uniref:DUF2229 domain-containing protein n=1 Tax=Clostridium cibarium TaxID=2762247 RepID=A0ABR8PY18_9CLOT|nr:acyl-CoA dehydratase activase-related protein [Clostridium cibarium]MBD7913060.1 hypothetical protein [Clostridium cibarium]
MSNKYNGELVGLSQERVLIDKGKWEAFLKILGVNFIISDLRAETSVEKANSIFKFTSDYCYFRKTCLGQYVDLIDKECKILLVPVENTEGHLACNSTNFMAQEIAEYYKNKVKVLNFAVDTKKDLRLETLRKIAEYFCDSEKIILQALKLWEDMSQSKNLYLNVKNNKNITLLLIGRIFHFFDCSDANSIMVKYLTDKLSVRVVTAEDVRTNNIKAFMKAHKLVNNRNLVFKKNIHKYWPTESYVATILSPNEKIDGVILLKDCYCNAGIEEINVLDRLLKELNIPSLIISYSLEAQSTIETSLETFVEMIDWKRKEKGICTTWE